MTAFQKSVNITQAPAIEGQRANMNPISVLPSSVEGGWRAGPSGVTVARFVWPDATSGYSDTRLANTGTGKPIAFVPNEFGEAMLTSYLSESGIVIPANMPVGNPVTKGDYWVKNTTGGAVTRGMKAYAKLADGTAIFDATGQVGSHSGYVETDWYCATPGGDGELVVMTREAITQ